MFNGNFLGITKYILESTQLNTSWWILIITSNKFNSILLGVVNSSTSLKYLINGWHILMCLKFRSKESLKKLNYFQLSIK